MRKLTMYVLPEPVEGSNEGAKSSGERPFLEVSDFCKASGVLVENRRTTTVGKNRREK